MLRLSRASLIRSTPSVRFLWSDPKLFNESKTTETRASDEAEVLIRTVDDSPPVAPTSDSFLENFRSTPSYKSKIDLAKIYPNSSLDFTKEVKVSLAVPVISYGILPDEIT